MHAEAPNPLVRRFEEEVLVNTQDLYRAAARLTERAADAEDLVQETCLQAFRSFGQLRDARATKTWLFAILRSIFLRRLRSSSRRAEPVSLDDLDAAFPAFELAGGAALVVKLAELIRDWERDHYRHELTPRIIDIPPSTPPAA